MCHHPRQCREMRVAAPAYIAAIGLMPYRRATLVRSTVEQILLNNQLAHLVYRLAHVQRLQYSFDVREPGAFPGEGAMVASAFCHQCDASTVVEVAAHAPCFFAPNCAIAVLCASSD